MNRRRNFGLLAALTVIVFALTALAASGADARKKRGRMAKDAKLGELMGAFEFGMSPKQVLKALQKQIRERYAEKIGATADVYRQDKLRKKREEEIKRIRKTYTKFQGKKTGWDVSLIDDQFAHETNESMMVYWENEGGRNQRRFFFFHEGELYKMVIALNTKTLKGKSRDFSFFQNVLEKRYGPGKSGPGRIDWRSKSYRVAAIDKLRFYGTFILVIADPAREKRVAAAREANPKVEKKNNVIDSMVADETDEKNLDEANKNVIDRITN